MMSDEYAGVIITQFLLYMQSNSVWPCLQSIGDFIRPGVGPAMAGEAPTPGRAARCLVMT